MIEVAFSVGAAITSVLALTGVTLKAGDFRGATNTEIANLKLQLASLSYDVANRVTRDEFKLVIERMDLLHEDFAELAREIRQQRPAG